MKSQTCVDMTLLFFAYFTYYYIGMKSSSSSGYLLIIKKLVFNIGITHSGFLFEFKL